MKSINPFYSLPFDTSLTPVNITQGYHGEFSHFKVNDLTDLSYCLDFGMPFGTPVLAARTGVVRLIHATECRCYRGLDRPKALGLIGNLIQIEHNDGTVAHYEHLDANSILRTSLRAGLQIAQGQPIALTGPSGWIGPHPHLHFMVFREKHRPYTVETFPVFR